MSRIARTGLIRRFILYLSMVRYGNAHNRDFAREHFAFFRRLCEDLDRLSFNLDGLRVLDVGCGKMTWLTLLLHSCGAQVTGIDTEWVKPGFSLSKYWSMLRTNGLERALRTLVWDSMYARPYYTELKRVCPFQLLFEGIDARAMSVVDLDFPDATFDLVVSHEVFEHLPNVDAALDELRRVMKPEAVTYIYTHSFTSISGGHHIAWKYPESEPSATVPPWDHLRDNRFPDIPSWVNGWREHQYRGAFERHFEVLDWIPTGNEGSALLTPEIRDELSQYTEHELLNKGFISVARPAPPARTERRG
ncbi:MAG: methyltransferase domain-containing protein [bacterium]|nr:methyltransferase domain-containing protein [bacterium]